MSPATAVDLFRQALWMTLTVSGPLLVIGLVAGIIISLIQVATSIQDPAFGAVPRLLSLFCALLILLPWMTLRLMAYTESLLGDFHRYVK